MLVLTGKTADSWKDVDGIPSSCEHRTIVICLVFHLYEFEKKIKGKSDTGKYTSTLYLSTYYLTVSNSIPVTANSDYIEKLMVYHMESGYSRVHESRKLTSISPLSWELHFN